MCLATMPLLNILLFLDQQNEFWVHSKGEELQKFLLGNQGRELTLLFKRILKVKLYLDVSQMLIHTYESSSSRSVHCCSKPFQFSRPHELMFSSPWCSAAIALIQVGIRVVRKGKADVKKEEGQLCRGSAGHCCYCPQGYWHRAVE